MKNRFNKSDLKISLKEINDKIRHCKENWDNCIMHGEIGYWRNLKKYLKNKGTVKIK